MNARTRRERWILRERRRCARDGFCRICISARVLPLLRATQELVGRQVLCGLLDWARTGEEGLMRRIFPELVVADPGPERIL